MDKLFHYGGIVLIVFGILIILSALPQIPLSVVNVGPISAEVSEVSATRIIVGLVITAVGFFAYKRAK